MKKHLMSLWEMILKHFKIIIRSKITLLTILMGPLLIIFIVGMAFNNQSLQTLNAGIYINDGTNYTNTSFETENPTIQKIYVLLNESFSINYETSKESCVQEVKKGNYHACLEIPSDINPENPSTNNYINIYVDFTQVNLAYTLLAEISDKVSIESRRVSTELAQKLVEEISNTENTINNDQTKISSAQGKLSTISTDLDSAKTNLDSMNLELGTGLENLGSLPAAANEVSNGIEELTILSDMILQDYESTALELENKQETYDSDCDNSTSTYCEELDAEISEVENRLSTLSDYITHINNETNFQGKLTIIKTISQQAANSAGALETNLAQAESIKQSAIRIIDEKSLAISMASFDLTEVNIDLSNLVLSYAEIDIKDPNKIINPLNIEVNTVAKEGTFLDYSFPLLIILVISFLGILLSSNIIMIEKKSSAFFRNYLTPVKESIFLISVYVVMMVIMVVDVFIVMLTATLFFNFNTSLASLPSLLPAIILIASTFILIGMSIGFIFKDEEGATITSIFVSTILFLFSPIIIPLENMSALLSGIANYSPLVAGMNLLKKIILFEVPISQIGFEILILSIYIIILIVLMFLAHEVHKKRI